MKAGAWEIQLGLESLFGLDSGGVFWIFSCMLLAVRVYWLPMASNAWVSFVSDVAVGCVCGSGFSVTVMLYLATTVASGV